jgi:hypothetical protein
MAQKITHGFQKLVKVRDGESRIGPEEPHHVTICVSRNDWFQYHFPSAGAVHITGAQSAAFQMAELVEDKQWVIAHAAEVTVPGGAPLCSMGRAD